MAPSLHSSHVILKCLSPGDSPSPSLPPSMDCLAGRSEEELVGYAYAAAAGRKIERERPRSLARSRSDVRE